MSWLLVAASLPGLFIDAEPSAATGIRDAGVDCVWVAEAQLPVWKSAGGCVQGVDLAKRTKLPSPGVEYRMNRASASNAPWVNTNGWRYVRGVNDGYIDAKEGFGALAAAEAHAYGAAPLIKASPKDWMYFGQMLRFLGSLPNDSFEPVADIGFVDDGSAAAGENLNLLLRRNLLCRVVAKPDPALAVNVSSRGGDPSAFAYEVRQKLGDASRGLRIFGSEVVVARLLGSGSQRKVLLLNYGPRVVEGLRVRVLGKFGQIRVRSSGGFENAADIVHDAKATEFSLPSLATYTVIALQP